MFISNREDWKYARVYLKISAKALAFHQRQLINCKVWRVNSPQGQCFWFGIFNCWTPSNAIEQGFKSFWGSKALNSLWFTKFRAQISPISSVTKILFYQKLVSFIGRSPRETGLKRVRNSNSKCPEKLGDFFASKNFRFQNVNLKFLIWNFQHFIFLIALEASKSSGFTELELLIVSRWLQRVYIECTTFNTLQCRAQPVNLKALKIDTL